MKLRLATFLVLIFAFIFSLTSVALASGITATSTPEALPVSEGQAVFEGNYIKAGNVIDIKEAVNGDVIVAGSSVTIAGPVAGDVIVVANMVKINGPVFGSVRVLANSLEIDSIVKKNVWVLGNITYLSPESQVGWDVYAGGSNVELNGVVFGQAHLSGETVVIGGEVNKDVYVALDTTGELTLKSSAKINGNLTYQSEKSEQLVKEDQATIGGTVKNDPLSEDQKSNPIDSIFYYIWQLFAWLMVAVVLLNLAPKFLEQVRDAQLKETKKSLLYGFLILLLTPLSILLLFFTLIGIPLAILLLVFYLASLFLAKIFIAHTLGLWLWENLLPKFKLTKISIWPLVLGMIVYLLLSSVPILGFFIKIVLIIWTLGALALVIKQSFNQLK